MTRKAMLHSLDQDGLHTAPLQDVTVLHYESCNRVIVKTEAGITCTAVDNPFTGYLFADDVYGIIKEA